MWVSYEVFDRKVNQKEKEEKEKKGYVFPSLFYTDYIANLFKTNSLQYWGKKKPSKKKNKE